MAPHLHLSGDTLEQVRETLHTRYGGSARLIAADKVRDAGVGGLLGRWHVEVVAELPDGVEIDGAPTDLRSDKPRVFVRRGRRGAPALPDTPTAGVLAAGASRSVPDASTRRTTTAGTAERDVAAHDLTSRSGLAALLAAADAAETSWTAAGTSAQHQAAAGTGAADAAAALGGTRAVASRPAVPELDTPATRGEDFAALLTRLGTDGSTAVAGTVVDAQRSGAAPGNAAAPGAAAPSACPPSTDVVVARAETAADLDAPGGTTGRTTHQTPEGAAQDTRSALAEEPPRVLAAAGDLVVVLGVGIGAADAARQMSLLTGSVLYAAGPVRDGSLPGLESARSAIAARAGAVRAGVSAVVGYGLGSPAELATRAGVTAQLSTAVGLGADQVWLVVDARHKTEDVDPWVRRVCSRVPVDALVVVGAGETSSPETIDALGLPVGWVDGGPAARAVLAA